MTAFVQLCFALVLAQASPTPSPSPSGGVPAPLTSPSAGEPAPSATPATTAPSAAPAAPATPPGSPIPYQYRFVPHQPEHPVPGQPQIFAVYLNAKKLHSQGPIDIRVETSPEVVKVVTRSNGHDGVVPMIAPGVFAAESRLPKLPIIASGLSITIEFIATGADGHTAIVRVPVNLQ